MSEVQGQCENIQRSQGKLRAHDIFSVHINSGIMYWYDPKVHQEGLKILTLHCLLYVNKEGHACCSA
jgi:hypothetical protein